MKSQGFLMIVFLSLFIAPTKASAITVTVNADGLTHISNSVTLLELSVAGLNATEAVPFDDVYAVGFYGHGELYTIGYVIAKSIVEDDGPEGLAAFLKLPPYKFVLRYAQLPKYGMDKDHPKLGPTTVNAADLLARECK